LNADLVQAELIEGDDTLVAWTSCVFDRTRVDPVSDRSQQSEHELLEELGIAILDQVEKIPPKTLLNVLHRHADVVSGRSRSDRLYARSVCKRSIRDCRVAGRPS